MRYKIHQRTLAVRITLFVEEWCFSLFVFCLTEPSPPLLSLCDSLFILLSESSSLRKLEVGKGGLPPLSDDF